MNCFIIGRAARFWSRLAVSNSLDEIRAVVDDSSRRPRVFLLQTLGFRLLAAWNAEEAGMAIDPETSHVLFNSCCRYLFDHGMLFHSEEVAMRFANHSELTRLIPDSIQQ